MAFSASILIKSKYFKIIIIAASILAIMQLFEVVLTHSYTLVEINVSNGMKRETIEIMGFAIHSNITDTRFSRFYKANVGSIDADSWRYVSKRCLPPFSNRPSPSFILGGAFVSLDNLMIAFELESTGELRQQELAYKAIHLLKNGKTFSVSMSPEQDDGFELVY